LRYKVAGIGASTALAAIAEIGPTMLFNEIGIENIERRTGRLVLANPKVPVGFDIEGESAGKTAPIERRVTILLFSRLNEEICFYQDGGIDLAKIIGTDLAHMTRSQFAVADNNGIQPDAGSGIFPRTVMDNLVDPSSVILGDGNVQGQALSFWKVVVKAPDGLQNLRAYMTVRQVIPVDAIQRNGYFRHFGLQNLPVPIRRDGAVGSDFRIEALFCGIIENSHGILPEKRFSAARNADDADSHLIQDVDDALHTLQIEFVARRFLDVTKPAPHIAAVGRGKMREIGPAVEYRISYCPECIFPSHDSPFMNVRSSVVSIGNAELGRIADQKTGAGRGFTLPVHAEIYRQVAVRHAIVQK